VNSARVGHEQLRQVSALHRRSLPGWSRGEDAWNRSTLLALAIGTGVAALVLRLVEAAAGPTDWSGAQYVLGSRHFDVTGGAPSPPGYWLYVALGHAVHVATGLGAVRSLVLLGALSSAAAVALTVVAGTMLVGRWVGFAAAALVASTPVSWFNGSTVSTYSFCALVGTLLVVLARLARRGTSHGIVAVVILGIATGFMPWVLPMFALLALMALSASIRSTRQLLVAVLAGVVSIAVWFVPMVWVQPGHLQAWTHALRAELSSSAHASSVFYSGSAAATNFGVFGAYSLLSLWPAIALAVVTVLVLGVARLTTRRPAGDASRRIWSGTDSRADLALDTSRRPWYQRSSAILAAAIVPPLAIVVAGRFPSGGAVLSYLPAATVLSLWPLSRLLRHRVRALRLSGAVVATIAVTAACLVNCEQFLESPGILPGSFARTFSGLWISQSDYGAPYPDTVAAITAADRADDALGALGRSVDPQRDVLAIVADSSRSVSARDAAAPSASTLFRIAGSALPKLQVAFVDSPGRSSACLSTSFAIRFVEHDGLLYYERSSRLGVGPGGHALVLVAGGSHVMTSPQRAGLATNAKLRIAEFTVWEVAPGAALCGITVTETTGHHLGPGQLVASA
jgi:hypothetical protein